LRVNLRVVLGSVAKHGLVIERRLEVGSFVVSAHKSSLLFQLDDCSVLAGSSKIE
jgi:hypothetical protein